MLTNPLFCPLRLGVLCNPLIMFYRYSPNVCDSENCIVIVRAKTLTAANLAKIIQSLQAKHMVQLQMKMLSCPWAMVMHVKKISILKAEWKLLNKHSGNRVKYIFYRQPKLCIAKSH